MSYDDSELNKFTGYFEAKEPGRKERAQAWATAIGLQKVDGLTPSAYLIETAKQHIEGKLTQAQVRRRINNYYSVKNELSSPAANCEEADKVSERIVAIIHDGGFSFTPEYFISLHKKLFKGILPHAGKLRHVNIKKREWILKGDSVTYGDYASLKASMTRHFLDEKEFAYEGKSTAQIIPHFARFIAQIWQIHPFTEGNTRTTAVFAIKYLRALGYPVTNNIFSKNSWCFRNALVRANYADYSKGVTRDWSYLEAFFHNLLLNEQNILKNRTLLIDAAAKLPRSAKKVSRPSTKSEVINEAINEAIKNEPGINKPRLMKKFKKSRATIERALAKLIAAEKVEHRGSKKTGGYWPL